MMSEGVISLIQTLGLAIINIVLGGLIMGFFNRRQNNAKARQGNATAEKVEVESSKVVASLAIRTSEQVQAIYAGQLDRLNRENQALEQELSEFHDKHEQIVEQMAERLLRNQLGFTANVHHLLSNGLEPKVSAGDLDTKSVDDLVEISRRARLGLNGETVSPSPSKEE